MLQAQRLGRINLRVAEKHEIHPRSVPTGEGGVKLDQA
jgi:hypothetical protein